MFTFFLRATGVLTLFFYLAFSLQSCEKEEYLLNDSTLSESAKTGTNSVGSDEAALDLTGSGFGNDEFAGTGPDGPVGPGPGPGPGPVEADCLITLSPQGHLVFQNMSCFKQFTRSIADMSYPGYAISSRSHLRNFVSLGSTTSGSAFDLEDYFGDRNTAPSDSEMEAAFPVKVITAANGEKTVLPIIMDPVLNAILDTDRKIQIGRRIFQFNYDSVVEINGDGSGNDTTFYVGGPVSSGAKALREIYGENRYDFEGREHRLVGLNYVFEIEDVRGFDLTSVFGATIHLKKYWGFVWLPNREDTISVQGQDVSIVSSTGTQIRRSFNRLWSRDNKKWVSGSFFFGVDDEDGTSVDFTEGTIIHTSVEASVDPSNLRVEIDLD